MRAEHLPAGLEARKSDYWDDVWWVSLDGTTIGAVRAVPKGFVTRQRAWPEARDFEEALTLILERRANAPP